MKKVGVLPMRKALKSNVSRANARNVRLYVSYLKYTDLFRILSCI